MYGKSPKMSSPKMPKSDSKKGMPLAIMIAVGKPKRAMPERGGRTATNMMKKSGRGK